MKKEITIGNITKVRWHYVNRKYGYMAWGHMRESFDKNFYISKQHPHLETAEIIEMDDSMNPDKFYAYIHIDKNNKLLIRNIFDSKNDKGFSQKNTFFEDELYYNLFLDDTNNLLDDYLKLGNCSRQEDDLLYFCVEYEPNNQFDIDLLIYCTELANEKTKLQEKLRLIDVRNNLNADSKKKSYLSFFSYFW
jgi:hypothetical protein